MVMKELAATTWEMCFWALHTPFFWSHSGFGGGFGSVFVTGMALRLGDCSTGSMLVIWEISLK